MFNQSAQIWKIAILKVLTLVILITTTVLLSVAIWVLYYGQFLSFGEKPFYDSFEQPIGSLARWQTDASGGCQISRTEKHTKTGRYSLEFSAAKGARCEMLPWVRTNILGRLGHEPFRVPMRYKFSIYIPEDWNFNNQNELLAQWHSSRNKFIDRTSRGPVLGLRIVGNQWVMTANSDEQFVSSPEIKGRPLWSGLLVPGRWVDWEFQARWMYNDTGTLSIFKDGNQIINYSGPNSFNDIRGVYLKIGSYHPGEERNIFFDDVVIEKYQKTISNTE